MDSSRAQSGSNAGLFFFQSALLAIFLLGSAVLNHSHNLIRLKNARKFVCLHSSRGQLDANRSSHKWYLCGRHCLVIVLCTMLQIKRVNNRCALFVFHTGRGPKVENIIEVYCIAYSWSSAGTYLSVFMVNCTKHLTTALFLLILPFSHLLIGGRVWEPARLDKQYIMLLMNIIFYSYTCR